MEKSKNWTNNMLFGAFVAFGFVIASLIIADAFRTVKTSNQFVTVKGYAEKEIMSDLAFWSCEFSVFDKDMVSSYNLLHEHQAKIVEFFEKYGFSKKDLAISSISSQRLYKLNEKGWQSNQIDGYRLSQSILIEDKDIKKIHAMSLASSELLKDGIEIESHSPEYYYTKINDLKIEMLSEASKDAKIRAEALAKNGGGEVGSIKAASQGVFQITPKNSTDVSDWGWNDVNSMEKVIKAVVTVDYFIK